MSRYELRPNRCQPTRHRTTARRAQRAGASLVSSEAGPSSSEPRLTRDTYGYSRRRLTSHMLIDTCSSASPMSEPGRDGQARWRVRGRGEGGGAEQSRGDRLRCGRRDSRRQALSLQEALAEMAGGAGGWGCDAFGHGEGREGEAERGKQGEAAAAVGRIARSIGLRAARASTTGRPAAAGLTSALSAGILVCVLREGWERRRRREGGWTEGRPRRRGGLRRRRRWKWWQRRARTQWRRRQRRC